MSNPRVGALFLAAARETRDDVQQTAWRLMARATDLAAHTSGALARQLDEWGGQLSVRLSETVTPAAADVLAGLATRAGDRLIGLGERLSTSHPDRDLPGARLTRPYDTYPES